MSTVFLPNHCKNSKKPLNTKAILKVVSKNQEILRSIEKVMTAGT